MSAFRPFFNESPALYLGLFLVIGISSALESNYFVLTLCIPLIYFCYLKWYSLLGILIAIGSFFLVSEQYHFENLPKEGVESKVKISIEQLQQNQKGFHSNWIYKGKILETFENNLKLKNVPYSLTLPKKMYNPANSDYKIHVKILPSYGKKVILKTIQDEPWEKVPLTYSWAEWRFKGKQTIKQWIAKHFQSQPVAIFLSGLVVGEFDDSQLVKDFGRFGLLHLLAISGFHFSILANGLHKIGRFIFPPKILSLIIMVSLSIYFLFLGWGPSVIRAWMTLLIFFGGSIGKKRSYSLNSLGFALLFSLTVDPLLINNLGYQFSFLATAALLLLQKPTAEFIRKIFPQRSYEQVKTWPLLDQGFYIFLSFFIESFVLSLAISWVALPISLYYFQKFPFLSLFYNLFFPFLVGQSMSLLLLGFIFTPIPWISSALHKTNDYFTSFLLNMTFDIPDSWDLILVTPPIPIYLVIIVLILTFLIPINLRKKEDNFINLPSQK